MDRSEVLSWLHTPAVSQTSRNPKSLAGVRTYVKGYSEPGEGRDLSYVVKEEMQGKKDNMARERGQRVLAARKRFRAGDSHCETAVQASVTFRKSSRVGHFDLSV